MRKADNQAATADTGRECREAKTDGLTTMAMGLAHDFNNLLAAVSGNNSIVQARAELDEELAENVRQIQESAEQAIELTAKVLMYSGKAPLFPLPLSIDSLLEEIKPAIEDAVPRPVSVECRTAGTLPRVEGDREQIRQMVMALVANAAEAIVDREGLVTVSTGMAECDRRTLDAGYGDGPLPEGPYAYIEVEDTGCGVSKKVQARMFDPFFSTKIRGQGLGLAVAFGVVRAHRGCIRVRTARGEGSTFTALFPCSKHGRYADPQ